MVRQRNLIAAKMAVVLLAIPIIMWAYEFGPDPGYSGVPKELGTCATGGQCHIGTANNSANTGSVAVSFPNGNTYTPGVKQHLTVTISDPTQHSWGFQLTARLADSTQAGTFASSDATTTMMCARSDNVSVFQEAKFSAGKAQTCPAAETLQYIEHSLAGYSANRGQAISATYQFDWTPPATNVGDITVYVAGNASVGAPGPSNFGSHIYTTTYKLTPSAGGNPPTITANGVVSGASFQPGIVPDSWLTIQGSNLSSVTDTWEKAIVNGKLPTTLDGVSVNVGSKPAFVYFVSPGQINVQAPDVGTGPVPVTVTTANGTSTAFTATVVQQAPAFFQWPGSQTVATRQDGSLAVKSGTFAGATTVAAKPGDVLTLWGTGFGPTTPSVAAGIQVPSAPVHLTASPVSVKIGTVDVQQFGCALAPGFAGLYQVNIQLPASMADGDYPIVATVAGVSSPDGVILSVKK